MKNPTCVTSTSKILREENGSSRDGLRFWNLVSLTLILLIVVQPMSIWMLKELNPVIVNISWYR